MQSLNQDKKPWIESTIMKQIKRSQMVKLFSKTSVDSNLCTIKIKQQMFNMEITKFQPEAWIPCLIMTWSTNHSYLILPNWEEIRWMLVWNHQWTKALLLTVLHSDKWPWPLQVKLLPKMSVHVLIGKLLTMLLLTQFKIRKNLSQDAHSGLLIVKHTAPLEADGKVSLLTLSDN